MWWWTLFACDEPETRRRCECDASFVSFGTELVVVQDLVDIASCETDATVRILVDDLYDECIAAILYFDDFTEPACDCVCRDTEERCG